jgi:CRP-like cAMP-binding protein
MSGWYEVDLGLKHEELAALVGITRPTLTHTLTGLRKRGFVVGTRGVYRVNPAKIKRQLEVLALAA